jgi:hypothetical protein
VYACAAATIEDYWDAWNGIGAAVWAAATLGLIVRRRSAWLLLVLFEFVGLFAWLEQGRDWALFAGSVLLLSILLSPPMERFLAIRSADRDWFPETRPPGALARAGHRIVALAGLAAAGALVAVGDVAGAFVLAIATGFWLVIPRRVDSVLGLRPAG